MKYAASKKMFGESMEQVEKWSKIVTFISQKIAPLCGVSCGLIPSFYSYFVTDLGSESFKLPVPMW